METMLNHSSTRDQRRGVKRRDQGAAMVIAVIVATVAMAFGGVMLSYADRESSSSNNDRLRQHAIDAAMAGAVVANSALASDPAYPGTGLVTVADGDAQFEVTVVPDPAAPDSYRRILTAHGYAPSKASAIAVRSVRQVVELDPVTFEYGVFAGGNFGDGSSSTVIGGIYTGGNVALGNAHDYIGDVNSRGNIVTGSNQKITGTLHANGDVSVNSGSTSVYGSVYAGGNITTGGTIRDIAQAGGSIGCANVQGSCIPFSPPPSVPLQLLPNFVWDPANYVPEVPHYVNGSQIVAATTGGNVHGVYYVTGDAVYRKQDTLQLDGDLTIVASGNVTLPGNVTNATGAGVNVQLTIVAGGNVTASNNLTVPATVPTLVYTRGNFDAKNSSTWTGVLYAAGNISIGAHGCITHAPVSAPGFDWSDANPQSFSIRNISTRETTGS